MAELKNSNNSQQDGNWTGMVGALSRDEADISSVDLSITIERSQAIDYTIIVYQVSLKAGSRTKFYGFIP